MWVLTQELPMPNMDQTNWNVEWLILWASPATGHRLWATRDTWPAIVRRLNGKVGNLDVTEVAADQLREMLHVEWMDVNIWETLETQILLSTVDTSVYGSVSRDWLSIVENLYVAQSLQARQRSITPTEV
jgi:hypothetical protein